MENEGIERLILMDYEVITLNLNALLKN